MLSWINGDTDEWYFLRSRSIDFASISAGFFREIFGETFNTFTF